MKPTRKERDIIKSRRLVPENWLIERKNHESMTIVHRTSNKSKIIHL